MHWFSSPAPSPDTVSSALSVLPCTRQHAYPEKLCSLQMYSAVSATGKREDDMVCTAEYCANNNNNFAKSAGSWFYIPSFFFKEMSYISISSFSFNLQRNWHIHGVSHHPYALNIGAFTAPCHPKFGIRVGYETWLYLMIILKHKIHLLVIFCFG